MHASYACMSSMLYMQELHAEQLKSIKHAVWVQVVKKATPPLIHPHISMNMHPLKSTSSSDIAWKLHADATTAVERARSTVYLNPFSDS